MPRGTEDVASSVHAGFLGSSPDSIPVTDSDTTDDPNGPFRALRSVEAGVVRALMATGQTRDLNFAAGEQRDLLVLRVFTTGTTVDVAGIEGIK
jgi:hypothetical protein